MFHTTSLGRYALNPNVHLHLLVRNGAACTRISTKINQVKAGAQGLWHIECGRNEM